jgi:predicted O-linked N-acetylglucosamine transferase (SPINDLY family)
MITLKGEKMVSRVSASLLTAIGMEELICNSYSGKLWIDGWIYR